MLTRGIDMVARRWVLLSGLVLVAITLLSLWPLAQLPAVPGSDKTHHLVAYMALALPVALARPRHWGWVLLGYLGWSGAIELLQPFVNRYGEWLDLLANGAGLLLGAIVAALWHGSKRHRPAAHDNRGRPR